MALVPFCKQLVKPDGDAMTADAQPVLRQVNPLSHQSCLDAESDAHLHQTLFGGSDENNRDD